MERYRALAPYLRAEYGQRLYKLALDGGMTCPVRDGTIDTRGCIFCDAAGSGTFAAPRCASIDAQIENAKKRVAFKAKNCGYIAYFQSFTNTYAPVGYLREIFTAAIENEDISVLSVATRPDCLPEDVLALLAELNRRKPVWVELGLQTVHETTARYIRRGYDLPVFDDAVRRLKKAGIKVIVHVILGLPGETPEMMYETVRRVGECGADGIKLQLLHVLRGTDLCRDYEAGRFEVMTMEDYVTVLEGCIRRLPPDMVVHRLTGDGAKRSLVAPAWSGDKKAVLAYIAERFERDDVRQGSLWSKNGQK